MTSRDLPLPVEPQTPHTRLARRVEAAVSARGEAAVAGLAVRLLTGAPTPEDVTSGAARDLIGDDGELTPGATGALALGVVWHRGAAGALVAALDAPEPEVRAAALLVLAARADRLRADAQAGRAFVEAVTARASDADPQVREAAASALGALARAKDLSAVEPVLSALVMDVDPELATAAELALAHLAARLDRPELDPTPQA
ncbi:HEAT repeat domain-containing protein [Micrococcus sp. ACRRV]|uniref:HEAT repeat domain-containing protein n=1 Tax=Micrococcus sp. ACRRV TaxID=2918203 RepID=UPI001EF2C133|nr:HEAT repeat domain-containing protein [Micrococcus sp. ACRRV]MCG7423013.1 HEAT repeat domain-containing protein [Micrococcus sp. ACRRV]